MHLDTCISDTSIDAASLQSVEYRYRLTQKLGIGSSSDHSKIFRRLLITGNRHNENESSRYACSLTVASRNLISVNIYGNQNV